ncbi:tRNA 2-thiouridine(34) synthase MnmA [Candidatus Kaiserbacteria bacterium]|nr:tRNA 2-thiouridine(34) synthase MnmA [Candidatus Kaiserbacteria bacterium]
MEKKVFVGLSGGVDSAVSAALLQREGYAVVGAFIKIWQPEFTECTWREDRLDAMRVCAALGIPFKEIDLSEEYKTRVIEEMITSYRTGKTPNPDVLCNSSIKFGSFMRWAHEEGAEYVATGHYARAANGKLLRGIDEAKDQSYFLHRLESKDLARILFPVGTYRKSEVRALAQKFELPVARKPDSQGLCFAGAITLPEFLAKYIPLAQGDVLDTDGKKVGTHDGAALYTRGQRHGFRMLPDSPHEAPHYVVSTDVGRNTVTVSAQSTAAEVESVALSDMHWIHEQPDLSRDFSAQARYRETPFSARILVENSSHTATFAHPHVVSPGQSLVLYDDDVCLGGGEISPTMM